MKFTIPLPLQREHEALHERLRDAAQRAGRGEIVGFADALIEHARTEEDVMYPAAVLVGQVVRHRLGRRVPTAA